MSTHHYLAAFRRYWLAVVAAAALAGLVALGLSQTATPLYTASAKLYFSLSVGSSATDLNQGSSYIQGQMLSYAQLAVSPTVLEPVIDRLGLETSADNLAESVTVTTPQNTAVLEVAVTRRSAEEARRITNAVATSIASAVKEVAPEIPDEGSSVSANIIASPTVPTQPSSPNTPRNLLAGVLIGLIIGLLAVVLRERFDTRVRTAEDLQTASDLPLLGVVEAGRHNHHAADLEAAGAMESYRRLCARLDPAPHTVKALSLLFTSPTPRERKSEVVLGVAAAFAERGRRVLVLDLDIRRPQLARLTGLASPIGLTTVLADDAKLTAAIQHWEEGGIDVLLSGEAPLRPGEVLASKSLPLLLKKLASSYDVLLIDAAPVNTVADAMVLGRHVQGAVLVADATRTEQQSFTRATDSLTGSHVKVKGTVLIQGHVLGTQPSTTSDESGPVLRVMKTIPRSPSGTRNT